GVGGQEAQEGVDVEVGANLLAEAVVVGATDEPGEVDEPLLLLLVGLAPGPVALLVRLPGVAEVGQAALEPLGLEQHPPGALEAVLEEDLVHLLDEDVEADVLLVVLA